MKVGDVCGACCGCFSDRQVAQINVNNNKMHVGTFKNEKEAAKTYNGKVFGYSGEFAYLNVIEE